MSAATLSGCASAPRDGLPIVADGVAARTGHTLAPASAGAASPDAAGPRGATDDAAARAAARDAGGHERAARETASHRSGGPPMPGGVTAGQPAGTRGAPEPVRLPPGVQLAAPLSVEDAVAIALWNNAQLRADLATLGLADADLLEAGLLRNPRLDLLTPVGIKPFEMLITLPIDALWQRPRRVAGARETREAVATRLIQTALDTARDTRLSYADLRLAQDRAAIATENETLRHRIADITDARWRAGDISELETVATRADARLAEEQRNRFARDITLAMARFRFALGLGLQPGDITLAADAPAVASSAASAAGVASPSAQTSGTSALRSAAEASAIDPPLDALLARAFETRPDLRAAEMAVAAAARRAGWERSRRVTLAAQLSVKEIGENGVKTGPGVSLDLPIFNHNQGLVARADAEVELAARQYVALKHRVALDVADASEQLRQSRQARGTLRDEVLPTLERAVALAEDQFRKGDAAYLFVLEQTRGLMDARLRIADADALVRRASAQLERSVGSR